MACYMSSNRGCQRPPTFSITLSLAHGLIWPKWGASIFTALCFHEWDCKDGKGSPLPYGICASDSKDRCTRSQKEWRCAWKNVGSTTYTESVWLRLGHRMKITSKSPASGAHFILILIPPRARPGSAPTPFPHSSFPSGPIPTLWWKGNPDTGWTGAIARPNGNPV